MRYGDIVGLVSRRAGIPGEQAEAVVTATLRALAEQVSGHEFADLREQLPKELAQAVRPPAGGRQRRSLDGFYARVAELAGAPGVDPARASQAAVGALADAVSSDQMKDVFADLPPEFYDLLPDAGGALSEDAFFDRVRERAGVESRQQAQSATAAVLGALADRITAGQAQDLALHLPAAARGPLTSTPEQAAGFDRGEFLDRVAATGPADGSSPERMARAVLVTLAEAVPADELDQTFDQLPSDIARLARPTS